MTWLSIAAVVVAASATVLGGLLLLLKPYWDWKVLRLTISFGAGYMLAAAALAMIPESLKITDQAPLFFLAGYITIHFFEHTIVPHFHFGEETHREVMVNPLVGLTSIFGLSMHTLFDGISIGSGFLISPKLGLLIFGAVVLHKIPEGFTISSIMLASGRSRRTAIYASAVLAISTILGAVLISFFSQTVKYALPFSAGVTFYIAASDLVPIINESRGLSLSLAFFLGIVIFYFTDLLLAGYLI
ncbi:ZIP family metal transporter [bacterium]|nr:ZIP family metal transporter [bacterium]MCI0602049.1 ZIP family metal transporter [bacterium]